MNNQPSKATPKMMDFFLWPICCGVVRFLEPKFLCFRHSSCGLCWYITITSPTSPTLKHWETTTCSLDPSSNVLTWGQNPKNIHILYTVLFLFLPVFTSFNIFKFRDSHIACIIFWSCGRNAFSRASDGHTVSTRRTKSYRPRNRYRNDRIVGHQIQQKWIMNSKWCVFSNGFLEFWEA